MLNDLRQLIINFYNLDMNTAKGQKECSELIQVYGSDLKLYNEFVIDARKLSA